MKRFQPTWLNEGEVDEVRTLFRDDPILGPAARFLSDLRDFVNQTTDGWAYHGTAQSAGELQGMLDEARRNHYGWANRPLNYQPPTRKDVERVCRLAIANLKRKKHYQRINVAAYGAAWPDLAIGEQEVMQEVLQ